MPRQRTHLLQSFPFVHVLHVGCRHVQAIVRAVVLEVVVVWKHVLRIQQTGQSGTHADAAKGKNVVQLYV